MILAVDGTPYIGSGIDLHDCAVEAEAVRAAICKTGEGSHGSEAERIAVECAEPGPTHEHVGIVRPGMSLRTRSALAAAARSRGLETAHDERVVTIRERLRTLGDPDCEGMTDAHRDLDAIEREIERLRERVATLRGRARACEETGGDGGAMASFRDAAGSLADAETRRIAVEQRLERRRRELRAARDRRERRLRLEDRAANEERAARRRLAAAIEDRVADALAAIPGRDRRTEAGSAQPMAAALATARVAAIRAPIVLDVADGGWFTNARAATRWLDAPIVRV